MRSFIACMISIVLFNAPTSADSTFTYQGELGENGQMAQGEFSMRFSLWDSLVGGNQIGATVVLGSVSVSDGRFAVELDFGAEVFDNSSRWLEITVDGFTLNPRQEITRSPYSIQTRGIFVDENENVGLGTTSPQFPLHIRAAQPYVQLDDTAGGSSWLLGLQSPAVGFNIQELDGGTRFVINEGGNVGIGTIAPAWSFDVVGESRFRERLGIGVEPGFGQLTVRDTDPGALFGIYAESTSNLAPTIFAENENGGPALWVQGTSDASPSGGGLIVVGAESSRNIAIDSNEIMARDDGQASDLFLNHNGGEVNMGQYDMHPAFAYGRIRANGSIVSASANVTGVRIDGIYMFVQIAGGVASTDIALVTDSNWNSEAVTMVAQPDNGELRVAGHGPVNGWQRSDFSFVIYRP